MFKAPRGTADVLPEEQKHWRYVEATAVSLCRRFGYQRVDTPVFEDAGLFVRTVGEGTDIVEKETYTFPDRGNDLMTLRAEGTAPVCRAYLEHSMFNLPQPVRLYYFCPIFRYERPQAGRYREHHQFGVEVIGDADPAIDAEVIQLGWRLLASLGLKGLSLVVNSIGDAACRPKYLESLKAYYKEHLPALCPDCRSRYERNPLRLLDCKRESCRPYVAQAPRSVDYLCPQCREHWDRLCRYLTLLGMPYRVEHTLVRGLDYYTRTVFEIQPPEEGAQSTILGGGRYDGLIQELGGRPTPGVGFGSGIERMVLNLKRQGIAVPEASPRPVFVAYVGQEAKDAAIQLASRLRDQSITAVLAPGGKSLKAQMRHASALNARYVLILGEEEVKQGTVALKDMEGGTQESLPQAEVSERLGELVS